MVVVAAVVVTAAAFAAVAFAAVAFAAVGDPHNQPVYQGSAGYTDQLVEQIQLRLARAGYYRRTIWIRWLAVNAPKLLIWQNYIPEGDLLSRARRGEVDPSVLFSKTGE